MTEPGLDRLSPRPTRPTAPTPELANALALTATGGPSPEQLASELRFVPGTLFAGRFRIVAAVGRGGMGEVYQAEDLRLRQPVALKFLPQDHAADRDRLERLIEEVRLARGVAHPNVCRVYDFVEADGESFVAMEYVDGESLAALLRRLGRLPPERTLALAHEIVRGLAAVHERGILHRDLKPENVMVDGRGHARLMDFGVASLSAEAGPDTVLMGTPVYVAPEQFHGGPPSSRTDVYALGVLLYELLTGRLPWGGNSLDELVRYKSDAPVPPPSSLAPGVLPELEALVLRCLDRDPAVRPASARAVAETLPGGDVLDVALAAGDTPDREVVAEAADVGALSRRRCWAAFAGTLASLTLFGLLLPQTSLLGQVGAVSSRAALEAKADTILEQSGWNGDPQTVVSAFGTEWSRYHAIGSQDTTAARWRGALRGYSPLLFSCLHTGRPAQLTRTAAAASVVLDHTGRLVALEAAPALNPRWPGAGEAVDWRPLFVHAGLDPAAFAPVMPRLPVAVDHDRRTAWQGPFPGQGALRAHVEAAALDGRVASFRVLREDAVDFATTRHFEERMALGHRLEAILLAIPFLAAVWLALRHQRLGRVDRAGSARLAAAFFGAGLLARLLEGATLVSIEAGSLTAPALGQVLTLTGFAWLLYMAAEPYVRRRWPRPLVGWARLLGGRFADPIVGRDLLLGVLTGALTCVLLALARLPQIGVLMPPLPPFMPNGQGLLSPAGFLAELLLHAMIAFAFGLTVLVALVLIRSLLRNDVLAVSLGLLVVIVPHAIYVEHEPAVFLALHFAIFYPATVLVRRAGLLAFVAFYFTFRVLVDLAGSADPATWTGRQGLFALLALAVLACAGLATSLGLRLRRADA